MFKCLEGMSEFQRFEMVEMATELLEISFDINEWSDEVFESTLEEVVEQLVVLKKIKDNRSQFDTTTDLWDLLDEAFKKNYFQSMD